MAFNTGNPVGSTDPRDLIDNSRNLDDALNSDELSFQDRLGRSRLTFTGVMANAVGIGNTLAGAIAGVEAARSDAEESAAQAAASANTAAASANTAVAVVTGGTASLTPEPGKIPVGDGEGTIPLDWIRTMKMGGLASNDFNSATITGFYSGFGDTAGGSASANAPVGSGNVRLDVIVLRGPASITQMAIAANSENAKIWFRSGFVSGGNYQSALAAAPWRSLPNLQGNAVFQDLATAVKSLVYIEHYGAGTAGSVQTYGIDIHNYPGAKSGLVLHQYSNNGPVLWVDNTDVAPSIRINNTNNAVLNPDGPATATGDFQEWQTQGISRLRLRSTYVFEAFQVTPTFFRTEGTALSAQTPTGVTASTLSVIRGNTTNSGAAISINNSGGSGLAVTQNGPGVGFAVSLTGAAAGFYAGQIAGQDFGLQVVTAANSGRTLEVTKNGAGAGEAVRIVNGGTGKSLSVRDSAGERFGINADGTPQWSNSALEQSTVGPSGSASAAPAQPAKWMRIRAADGNLYVIPAYLVS